VAARTLSLARAATILNLTVPAVSRRIQLLERDLGMQLFQRLPRGLSLTDAGEEYFAALGPSWETVCNATEAARVKVRRRSAQDQRHADIRGELVGSAINAVSFAHLWRIGSRKSSEFAGGFPSHVD
jgi:DNA-binding transcriptional LysR family regulator